MIEKLNDAMKTLFNRTNKTISLDWIDDLAYEGIANKLKIDKLVILTGIINSDHHTLKQCREILGKAQWAFIREEDKKHVIARLEMIFIDGTAYKMEVIKHWDDIPSSIRTEFLKTGIHSLCKEWVLQEGA